MRNSIVPVMVHHAIAYASSMKADVAFLRTSCRALKLYNVPLYQTWWELLQLEIELNPDLGDFTYPRALDLCEEYMVRQLPHVNGSKPHVEAGRSLIAQCKGLEASYD